MNNEGEKKEAREVDGSFPNTTYSTRELFQILRHFSTCKTIIGN